MAKRKLLLLVLIILSSYVYASPDAYLDPVSVYEGNDILFNLTVNNINGDDVVKEIEIDMHNFNIINISNYLSWNESVNGSSAAWSGGSIGDNIIALFKFTAESWLVDADKNISIDVTMKNQDNQSTDSSIRLQVLNDDTPPTILEQTLLDSSFLLEGTDSLLVMINAEDNETGIKNISLSYWNCSNASDIIYADLDCNSSICSSTLNLSEYKEGESVCFEYIIYNNALGKTVSDGSVFFDNTPPSVESISPADNIAESKGNLSFAFSASDNLDPVLDCVLLIDNAAVKNIIAGSGDQASVVYSTENLKEAAHKWKVRCEDDAGLAAESAERNFIVGKAPVISLNIDKVERTKPYEIEITVDDESSVDSVSLIFGGDSINLAKNGNKYTGILQTDTGDALGSKTLNVAAEDKFGFTANEAYEFTLVQGYIIKLDLDPQEAEPEENIIISGTVKLDNGEDVPEEEIELGLPGDHVDARINNKRFRYEFKAPRKQKDYIITASIISSDGFKHEASIKLRVEREYPLYICGDGICQSNESCENCLEDCGECMEISGNEQSWEELINDKEDETGAEEPDDSNLVTGNAFVIDEIPPPPLQNVVTNPVVVALALLCAPGLYVLTFRKNISAKKDKFDWDNYFKTRGD